jgi:hypothetical protein
MEKNDEVIPHFQLCPNKHSVTLAAKSSCREYEGVAIMKVYLRALLVYYRLVKRVIENPTG